MVISRLITVEAMIHGYHKYKIVWLNLRPVIEEELSCEQDIGNAHAVAVCNIIDGDIKTVGHAPCKISALATFDLLDEVHG